MTAKTCARIHAECLKEHGVEYVFGMGAGYGDELMWAEIATIGIRPILIRDERSAVWMAEAYARTSGKPGVVCIGVQGAGHAITGLVGAYNGHVPIIILTYMWGAVSEQDKNEFHGPCHFVPDLYRTVTKKVFNFHVAERLPEYINAAFRCATTGIPGPVVVIHPDPMHFEKVDVDYQQDHTYDRFPAMRVAPDPELVVKAVELLCKAEKPVILTANFNMAATDFVVRQDACGELAELAALMVAPVAGGKGSLADSDPLYVGYPGTLNNGPFSRGSLANTMLSESDLVVMIGARPNVFTSENFTIPSMGSKVLHIDFDPDAVGRTYPVELGLVGDLKLSLRALIDAIKQKNAPSKAMESNQRVTQIRDFMHDWRAKTSVDLNSDEVPIHPARVMKELNDFIDKDTIVCEDGGHCTMIYAQNYLDTGQGEYLDGGTFGQIGTGIPMSLGAKLGAPDKRVILVAGDGGFNYKTNELETAARYNIPVLMVVFNNSTLFFDRSVVYELENQFPESVFRNNYDFTNIQFGKLAEALGCYGARVEKPDELHDAIKAALETGRPAVVDVVTKVVSRDEVEKMYAV